ncbi:MAG TPA: hypothetical protein VE777_08220, partial [Gaiellales bacterium]|nr:hypothetical protein [Gaiellales bacterium]
MPPWPATEAELVELQHEIGAARPPTWEPPDAPLVAGCFVCFPRGKSGAGAAGDPAVAAAAALRELTVVAAAVVPGAAGAPYAAGLLALR